MAHIVKCRICKQQFDTAKEAGSFIALLAKNNVKDEDEVTFPMKAVQEVEE